MEFGINVVARNGEWLYGPFPSELDAEDYLRMSGYRKQSNYLVTKLWLKEEPNNSFQARVIVYPKTDPSD